MALDEKELSFDDNSEEGTNVTTVKDDSVTDSNHGEQVNTEF